MQQRDAIGCQQLVDPVEILIEVPGADMLEHANRNYAIIRTRFLPIILESNGHSIFEGLRPRTRRVAVSN